jgi:hypothetical protein
MKVHSLIEGVLQRYASARLSADRGTAVVMVGDELLPIAFETSFERPDHFSFSFTAGPSSRGGAVAERYSYRIESDGPLVRMVGEPALHDDGTPMSLERAIASLTGISFGCAYTVPSFLMPERVGGRGLFRWPERVLRDPVILDGTPHLLVELTGHGDVARVFLDEVTLVVRRIEEPVRRMTTDYVGILTRPL